MTRILDFSCIECSSNNVACAARVHWDAVTQSWSMEMAGFDGSKMPFCLDCGSASISVLLEGVPSEHDAEMGASWSPPA